ncbi:hypothetical protein AB0E69_07305 [Kribbella sp. NPDC026611]|uniref:hypothetical protein n=1 Tax=Kribbella sp. NPDC026611 TaxID=3154911 RepID=UPI0033E0D678
MVEINTTPQPPGKRPPDLPPPVPRPEGTPAAPDAKKVDTPQAAAPAGPESDHFGRQTAYGEAGTSDLSKAAPGTVFVDAEVRKFDPSGKVESVKSVQEVIPPKNGGGSWVNDWAVEARKESLNARNDAETQADVEKQERHEAALHYTAQHIGDGETFESGATAATGGMIIGNWLFEGVKPNAADVNAFAKSAADGARGAYDRHQAARTDVPGKLNAGPEKPGSTSGPELKVVLGTEQPADGKGDGTSPEGRLNGAFWGPGGWMRDDSSTQQPWLTWERRVQTEVGEGGAGQSLYVAGKEFDTFYVNAQGEKVLVDAKYSFRGDFYDPSRFSPGPPSADGTPYSMPADQAAQMTTISNMINSQVGALGAAGATRVEWVVPDPELAKTLNATFAQMGLAGKISARYLK